MQVTIESKLLLSIDGSALHEVSLSYEILSSVVSNLEDRATNQEIFEILSQHPSANVREMVAYKDNLNEKTVLKLALDPSVNVVRNLVRTEGFKRFANDEVVSQLIERDVEVACSIAQSYELLESINSSKIIEQLISANDPAIVAALANNYSLPKKILKDLLEHDEPHVVEQARRTLGS